MELEEGDRSGAYLRVTPESGPAWVDSSLWALILIGINQVCSTPDRSVLSGGGRLRISGEGIDLPSGCGWSSGPWWILRVVGSRG